MKGKMDEYYFNWIKALQADHPDWTYKRISNKTGWSKDVVSRACRSKTYADYKSLVTSLNGETRTYTKMTEKLFLAIKSDLDDGLSYAEIAGRKKVGHNAITAVKKSESFKDYSEKARRQNGDDKLTDQKKSVAIKHPEVKTEWQRLYDSTVIQMADDLSKIRELLGFIVEQLK